MKFGNVSSQPQPTVKPGPLALPAVGGRPPAAGPAQSGPAAYGPVVMPGATPTPPAVPGKAKGMFDEDDEATEDAGVPWSEPTGTNDDPVAAIAALNKAMPPQ